MCVTNVRNGSNINARKSPCKNNANICADHNHEIKDVPAILEVIDVQSNQFEDCLDSEYDSKDVIKTANKRVNARVCVAGVATSSKCELGMS